MNNIEHTIEVFSSSKKMVGHVPEPLAKILFPLTKCSKILEIKVENRRKESCSLRYLGIERRH